MSKVVDRSQRFLDRILSRSQEKNPYATPHKKYSFDLPRKIEDQIEEPPTVSNILEKPDVYTLLQKDQGRNNHITKNIEDDTNQELRQKK